MIDAFDIAFGALSLALILAFYRLARGPRVLDRVVALKILSDRYIATEEDVRRFERESKLASKVRHPNLVRVYEAGVHDGVPFFTMEFVEGRTLDDLLLGLVVPSDGRWREGAIRLRTAAMRPDDWPPPAELPITIRQADVTVHELADEAIRATSPLEQAPVYSKLLLTCASCHGLHARIWGPKSQ